MADVDFSRRQVLGGGGYRKDMGLRPDGTPKGLGFLGGLKADNGQIITEKSIGVPIDGREMDIPTVVPTLNQQEINHIKSGARITDQIAGKAIDFATTRVRSGKSPFKD